MTENTFNSEEFMAAARAARAAETGMKPSILAYAVSGTSQEERAAAVQYVLEHSTNDEINEVDSKGNTALHYAARVGDVEGVKLLLASDRMNLDARNSSGETALTEAISFGSTEIVTELMNKGATVHPRDLDAALEKK